MHQQLPRDYRGFELFDIILFFLAHYITFLPANER